MAKSPKPSVRPPRIPKGEAPDVTIANLECQAENMIQRIMALVKERDDAQANLGKELISNKLMVAGLEQAKKALEEMAESYRRLLGWQDCARELIESLTLSPPK